MFHRLVVTAPGEKGIAQGQAGPVGQGLGLLRGPGAPLGHGLQQGGGIVQAAGADEGDAGVVAGVTAPQRIAGKPVQNGHRVRQAVLGQPHLHQQGQAFALAFPRQGVLDAGQRRLGPRQVALEPGQPGLVVVGDVPGLAGAVGGGERGQGLGGQGMEAVVERQPGQQQLGLIAGMCHGPPAPCHQQVGQGGEVLVLVEVKEHLAVAQAVHRLGDLPLAFRVGAVPGRGRAAQQAGEPRDHGPGQARAACCCGPAQAHGYSQTSTSISGRRRLRKLAIFSSAKAGRVPFSNLRVTPRR